MLENLGSILLELSGNVIGYFIWFIILSIFLDLKSKYKRNIALYLLGFLVLYVIKLIFLQYFIIKFIISIYVLFFIYVLYKGRFAHKIFTLCMSNCINYVTDMFIISLTNMGFNNNLFSITLNDEISGIWISIIKLVLFILVYIMLKNFAPNKTLKIDILSTAQALILTMLPAFSFVTIFILDKGVRDYVTVPINTSVFLLIASSGTLIYNVVIMILIDKLILNKRYKYLNEISEAQLITQFNHYEQIMEKNQQTRKLKHDMNNHLMCIGTLIENNKIEEAKWLLHDIETITLGLDLEISSGNSIADAILNEKNKLAQQYEIKFEFSGALPTENFINPLDISIIFSNALDNAIEAASKSLDTDRFVITNIKIQGKCLLILIKNSVAQDFKISGKEISSTKNNKEQHGVGLKNINDSVEKYGGNLNIKCENKIFSLEILFSKL